MWVFIMKKKEAPIMRLLIRPHLDLDKLSPGSDIFFSLNEISLWHLLILVGYV